jgi:hypothetical protein
MACAIANAATAASVDVVVDSTEATLKPADGGEQTAKVTVANISDSLVNLEGSIPGDTGCTVIPNPTSIQSGRRTEVTLTLSAACDVEGGGDVTLGFGSGVKPTSYVVKVAPAPRETRWPILGWSFLISSVVALVVASTVGVLIFWWNRFRGISRRRIGGSQERLPRRPQTVDQGGSRRGRIGTP